MLLLLLTAAALFPVHQSQKPLITKLQLAVLHASAIQPGLSRHSPWAAWYSTWLLIKLTPKGIVFSFRSFPFLFLLPQRHTATCRIAMVPISKVTLSVAVQHNKELEKQQAAIQQVMGLPVYVWDAQHASLCELLQQVYTAQSTTTSSQTPRCFMCCASDVSCSSSCHQCMR